MHLLSLQCTNYTAVCDQIDNKSFVLLNASILGKYREKPSLRSTIHAWRQDSVTGGGHKQILEEAQKLEYFESERVDQKTKVFIAKFHKIWGKDQQKSFHLEICADFHEFQGEITKKGSLLQNLQKNSSYEYLDNQYLGSLRPRTALQ